MRRFGWDMVWYGEGGGGGGVGVCAPRKKNKISQNKRLFSMRTVYVVMYLLAYSW